MSNTNSVNQKLTKIADNIRRITNHTNIGALTLDQMGILLEDYSDTNIDIVGTRLNGTLINLQDELEFTHYYNSDVCDIKLVPLNIESQTISPAETERVWFDEHKNTDNYYLADLHGYEDDPFVGKDILITFNVINGTMRITLEQFYSFTSPAEELQFGVIFVDKITKTPLPNIAPDFFYLKIN